jgi:hypothetical protein
MKLPKLNVPDSEKNEDWCKKVILGILSYYHSYDRFKSTKKKDIDNYNFVDGRFEQRQFEYVTKAYGLTAPARLVNYPLILPKLHLLGGELMSQPLQFTTEVINRSARRRKNEKKVALASEALLRPIRREIEKALGTKLEDDEVGMEVPKSIEEFNNMSFRDHVEEFVNIGLQDLIKRFDLKHEFKKGFYDLGIVAKEFYRVMIKSGFPQVERLDPRSVIYDVDYSKEDIEMGKFAGIDKHYSINEVGQMLPDLPKDKLDRLEEIENAGADFWNDANQGGRWYVNDEDSGLRVRVVYMQFRAMRAVKYKVSENKFDKETPFYKLVKDDYKQKKGEKIITRYIDDIWEGYLIGNEIVHGCRRMPNQIRYEENYAKATLSIFGIKPNTFSGSATSIVDSLKNVQTLYNFTMYHIELAMARSGGKSMVYDVSQKPAGYELTDVIHHAKNSGLIIINSQQEGYQTNTFNQFQQVDFSLSNSITGLFNLKMTLEDLADKLTGISAARAGINKSGDLVGVNERNVMQSSLITLPWFEAHYKVVGKVLNHAAGLMKIAYANEDRMKNLFGDNTYSVIKFDESIALDEVSVYVENNGKEIQDKQNMQMILQQAVSSGQGDLGMIAKAVRADSASEIERILESGITAINEVAQANEERNQALQQQANEINSQKIQVPLEVAKVKAQADIQVATINAQAKLKEFDAKTQFEADKLTAMNEHDLDKEMLSSSNRQIEQQQNNSNQSISE